ncbi:MAG: Flp pilus assembly complex ATPase component TadA [Planctomycetales bacterium]|nr:Flp pilus assembly complex ATPase component TadA [Planctomycetales bacterium]
MARKMLGQVLKDLRKVHEGQVQEALAIQRKQGGKIGEILVAKKYVSESDVAQALGIQAGIETVDLEGVSIPPELAARVPATVAQGYKVVPVSESGGVLTVAMADPGNTAVLDDLRFMTGAEVKGVLAPAGAIERAIQKLYLTAAAAAGAEASAAATAVAEDERAATALSLDDPAKAAAAAPVVKLLNLILAQAIKDQASDIHFEPFEEEFKVRYRVDGVLYEMKPPSLELAPALISRIKVLANLDIAETRLPQDGRILTSIGGRQVDLRISTLPTMFGESCVIRVLDRAVVSLDLERLGLRDRELKLTKDLINLPNGIILVTGPTGSGKTTTLYSALNAVNSPEWKIITTEDPVEYDLEGIVQVQVNEEIEVTYARCLRSILRQDPDVILVGEIRDQETAQIAIESALTGHLVFSTLHTNDAPSAITRMLDIGVESFLLAATLEAVIAQRLVRRVCTECREYYTPDERVLAELEVKKADIRGGKFARGRGCETCHRLGFKGRMAIFEIMLVTEEIRKLTTENASTEQVRTVARRQGMRSLRDAGLLAIQDGLTSVEEVLRETSVV